MRLLHIDHEGHLSLTRDITENAPAYAILSHTWGGDDDEVTFADMGSGKGRQKPGFRKIGFCVELARKDGLEYIWVDTCCIDKQNAVELQEAITSMFSWYNKSSKCYVYLADVSCKERGRIPSSNLNKPRARKRDLWRNGFKRPTQLSSVEPSRLAELSLGTVDWKDQFRKSRWFTRGWTLQELIAPPSVEFYSADKQCIGTRQSLVDLIQEITKIPLTVLNGASCSQVSVEERMLWVKLRNTKRSEDKTYCMLGIFDVSMPLLYGEGQEKAARRLRRAIDESTGVAASIHEHWLVPRPANSSFVGRQDLLEGLKTLITKTMHQPSRTTCRIVVWGIGGQGKSELCLQLAYRLRQLFWAVIWIDMNTQQIAEANLVDAAQRLSIPAQDWRSACSSIANLKQPWLLILDNADDPTVDYQDYFPDSRFGLVLMTTRNIECERYATEEVVALGPLDDFAAQQLLLKTARIPIQHYDRFREDVQTITNLLSSHALALTQAGAYVAQGRCTLAEYPRLHEQQRPRLMTFRPRQARSRYQDVYATFEVSAQMLEEMNIQSSADALNLLSVLAFVEHNRVPLFLFREAWREARLIPEDMDDHFENNRNLKILTPWHIRNLPSICDITQDTWDDSRLADALSLLQAFALVSLSTNDTFQSISTHPLVHAWARDRQNPTQRQASWLRMCCLLAVPLSDPSHLSRTQKRWLQPHVEACLSQNLEDVLSSYPIHLVVRVIVRCCWFLYRQRSELRSLAAVDKTMHSLRLDLTNVCNDWRGLYDLRAANLMLLGQVSEALLIDEALVTTDRENLDEKDEDRLVAEYNFALSNVSCGRYQDALALLEPLVSTHQELNSDTHPELLGSQDLLGYVYYSLGRAQEAVTMLETVVNLRKKSRPADDDDLLASQNSLAVAYSANGQLNLAIALLRNVLNVLETVNDESHPDVLTTQYNLGVYLYDSGDVEQAERLMRKVVTIRRQINHEEHPHRLRSEHELARYLWNLRRRDEALVMMSKVVEVRSRSLNEEHRDRLASECSLAFYRWELGERYEALAMMMKVAETRKRILPVGDRGRQQAEDEVVYMKRELGQLDEDSV